MPTILGAIGKKSPKKISGIDVFSARSHLMVIAEHVNDGALSLRTDRHSLIVREADGETEVELYDTDADFDERTNIAAENKIIVTRLLGLYKKLRSGFPTYPRISYPLPTWINEQDRQELIESGYF